jgi:hypothetical protein
MPEESCISCLEGQSAPITEHCRFCDAPLCAGHIFKCRKCNTPMCRPCWTEYGKDFCRTCVAIGQVKGR